MSISKKKQGVFESYATVSCCTLPFSAELLLCRKGTEALSRDRSETRGHTCANKTDPSLHFNSMNCSVILRVSKRCAHEQKKSVNTYDSNQVLWLLIFFFFLNPANDCIFCPPVSSLFLYIMLTTVCYSAQRAEWLPYSYSVNDVPAARVLFLSLT